MLLGDTSVTNMTTLPASVFSDTNRYLRVWFSSDNVTFTRLNPDRRIAAVPYALQAEEARNADTVDGQHAGAFWTQGGNSYGALGTLGTNDNNALELKANGGRVLRLEPNATSPNLIGGYSGNTVTAGAYGATIGGGGDSASPNRVTDNYGTVGGGRDNWAGDDAGTTDDRPGATVGGGESNFADGSYATVGGGRWDEATANMPRSAGAKAISPKAPMPRSAGASRTAPAA